MLQQAPAVSQAHRRLRPSSVRAAARRVAASSAPDASPAVPLCYASLVRVADSGADRRRGKAEDISCRPRRFATRVAPSGRRRGGAEHRLGAALFRRPRGSCWPDSAPVDDLDLETERLAALIDGLSLNGVRRHQLFGPTTATGALVGPFQRPPARTRRANRSHRASASAIAAGRQCAGEPGRHVGPLCPEAILDFFPSRRRRVQGRSPRPAATTDKPSPNLKRISCRSTPKAAGRQ
jgi:hypothetical protein